MGMSWTQAIMHFIRLFLGILLFLTAAFLIINLYGASQAYSRLDHPVMENLSDIIYLNESKGGFVEESSSTSLPTALQNTQFFHLQAEEDRLHELDPKAECYFLFLNFDTPRTQHYDEILAPLKDFDCVFVQTPYLNAKNYFSDVKPRWFYGVRVSQWVQFIFWNSLRLQSIAALDGDFVVINQSPSDLHPRILNELKKRRLILIIQQ